MLRQTQVFKVSLSELFSTLSGKFVGRVDKDHCFDRFRVQNSVNRTNLFVVEFHRHRIVYRPDTIIHATQSVDPAARDAVQMSVAHAFVVLSFDFFSRGKLIGIDRFIGARRDTFTHFY